jgi:hypothetical protein
MAAYFVLRHKWNYKQVCFVTHKHTKKIGSFTYLSGQVSDKEVTVT